MAGDVVYVGCKMPNGVYLDLDKYEILNKEQGTVRLVKAKIPRVRLRGNAVAFGKPDLSIDGYVFTPVDKAFWDQWLLQNGECSLLADGFIKPAASLDAGKRIAREHAAEPGLNAPLTENDPRTRGIPVEAADEQKSKGLAA